MRRQIRVSLSTVYVLQSEDRFTVSSSTDCAQAENRALREENENLRVELEALLATHEKAIQWAPDPTVYDTAQVRAMKQTLLLREQAKNRELSAAQQEVRNLRTAIDESARSIAQLEATVADLTEQRAAVAAAGTREMKPLPVSENKRRMAPAAESPSSSRAMLPPLGGRRSLTVSNTAETDLHQHDIAKSFSFPAAGRSIPLSTAGTTVLPSSPRSSSVLQYSDIAPATITTSAGQAHDSVLESVEWPKQLSLPLRSPSPFTQRLGATSLAGQDPSKTTIKRERDAPAATLSGQPLTSHGDEQVNNSDLPAAHKSTAAAANFANDEDSDKSTQQPATKKRRTSKKQRDIESEYEDVASSDDSADKSKPKRTTPKQPRPANNAGTKRWTYHDEDLLDIKILEHGDDYAAIKASFPDRTLKAIEAKVKERIEEAGWKEARANDEMRRSSGGRTRASKRGFREPVKEDEELAVE
jgi:hypothetical protein